MPLDRSEIEIAALVVGRLLALFFLHAAFDNIAGKGAKLRGGWRRRRDSNPR